MNVRSFVKSLSEQRFDHVFNPYADRCALCDRADAPARRRANLRAYLRALQTRRVAGVWLGRDLGYRGGRRTGLALTDEAHLQRCAADLQITLRRATTGRAVSERTAAAVWQARRAVDRPIAFWNAFPFHPHPAAAPFGNRAHSARERDQCRRFLDDFLALVEPEHIVAIGGDAHRTLLRFGYPDCYPVRHPSYGGQRQFFDGIAALYRTAGAAAARGRQGVRTQS